MFTPSARTFAVAESKTEWLLGWDRGWHQVYDRSIRIRAGDVYLGAGGMPIIGGVDVPVVGAGNVPLIAADNRDVDGSRISQTEGGLVSKIHAHATASDSIDNMIESDWIRVASARETTAHAAASDRSPTTPSSSSSPSQISADSSLRRTRTVKRKRAKAYSRETRQRMQQLEQLRDKAISKGVLFVDEFKGMEANAKACCIKGWRQRLLAELGRMLAAP
ncbi:hypothetical protein EJ03DRAFT_355808 [Teratosphaeria nubilosa]|uniref:Uncharacterized protein n=1 Tax=Teratosphaeria nubilosa TaxID=161662 RepID=A0A6G1KUP2_9PEZI|nr:hypothetical protein EJ03DRAFT_355808 [Teratosphaeria nubilosa]